MTMAMMKRTENGQGEVSYLEGKTGDEKRGYANGEGDNDFNVQGRHDDWMFGG